MMKRFALSATSLTLVLLIASCEKKTTTVTVIAQLSQSQKDGILNQGNKASAALLGNLGPKLKAAMQSGGPVTAISVCKEAAQPSTLKVSDTFDGLTLSRISLKSRNPENQADDFDQTILHNWEDLLSNGEPLPKAEVRLKNATTAIYYKPILTASICLHCHGDADKFPAELQQRLTQLYPDDQATGYQEGELRGAFRVEFPLPLKDDDEG